MQLFITEYTKKDNTIVIANSDLLSQLRKVLRANIGDTLWIQSSENEAKKTRYEVRITAWDNKIVECTFVSEQTHETPSRKTNMIIAMPNKWDKAELIAQKLSECAIDEIIFRPSERSIIRERNPKKAERLHKIIKEAVEQSRGRQMPTVTFTLNITKYLQDNEVIIFDKIGTREITPPFLPPHFMERETKKTPLSTEWRGARGEVTTLTGLVGPEGGLTKKDYEVFEKYNPKIMSLGETVLRMETAAIVGGRLLKNNFGG